MTQIPSSSDSSLSRPNDDSFSDRDVVIVGAGMGGCAAAYALARSGLKVLLIEKGRSDLQPDPDNSAALSDDPEYRIQRGRWPHRILTRLDSHSLLLRPALGCGLGGSTLIYAGSLGRLEPEDFDPEILSDGTAQKWPFSYEDLEPCYQEMERVFSVSGTCDPLASDAAYSLKEPVAMGDRDRHLFEEMRNSGLHPYRIHTSIRYVEGCDECGGRICQKKCKGDAATRLLEPALATGNLQILAEAEVLEVLADSERASGVMVRRKDRTFEIRCSTIALAAGALITPVILQRSRSATWPNGIGNDHDLVGRNLMFHASDFVAVWPRKSISRSGPGRTIAVRDFYAVGGEKFGEFQSMGLSAGYGEILTFLHQWLDATWLRRIRPVYQLMRIPAWIGARIFKEASVFATIVEDYPRYENRVTQCQESPSGVRVEYDVPEELRERVLKFRKLLKSRLKSLRVLVVNHDVSLNYGHACGTCRSGDNPETSVLDSECRVHGMENLYVLDGSFMPSSGGANPSLTIGANALRVAGVIRWRLQQNSQI